MFFNSDILRERDSVPLQPRSVFGEQNNTDTTQTILLSPNSNRSYRS